VNRVKVGICLAVCYAAAWALVNAYHVEPRTQAMSGWTRLPPHPSYYVSQIVTCNFDSLAYVELFAGDTCSGEGYNLGGIRGRYPYFSAHCRLFLRRPAFLEIESRTRY